MAIDTASVVGYEYRMSIRTRDELGKGLGSVIYEMLMLLFALSLNRRRFQYACYEDLTWGDPQIAIEVILLKCRSLMDFISPKRRSCNDIVITDFGQAPITLPHDVQVFRRSVNQWSAHLSWQRVLESPSDAPQPLQTEMDAYGFWLLSKANAVVRDCITAGIVLTEEPHQRFYRVFQREYTKITTMVGVELSVSL